MSAAGEPAPAIPWLSLFVISGATLAYEILLLRLFSIVQWHHFAFMVISLALLGHGISGVVITLAQRFFLKHFEPVFISCLLLFAVLSYTSFYQTQAMEFNVLEIFWSHRPWSTIAAVYALLCLPFLAAACAISLLLRRFPRNISSLYACDLAGAAAGALAMIVSLHYLQPAQLLTAISVCSLLAAAWSFIQLPTRFLFRLACLAVSVCLLFFISVKGLTSISPMQYKALTKTLLLPATSIEKELHSPLGSLAVVDSPRIPLRLVSGLSLAYQRELPPQKALFIDGESAGVLIQHDNSKLEYLDYLSSALPYHLRTPGHVGNTLLIGLNHSGLLQAHRLSQDRLFISENNRQLIQLLTEDYSYYSGWPLLRQRSVIQHSDIRSLMFESQQHYDLIQLPMADSAMAATLGLHSLSPRYHYTLEAFSAYWQRLSEQGVLAVTHAIDMPARTGVKVLNTVITLLQQQGINDPGLHLFVIRGWKTATVVVSKQPLGKEQIAQGKRFSQQRGFDLVHYPGISPLETNRINRLMQPAYYLAVQQLLSTSAENFVSDYKFLIEAASDDKPYFYHFLKWSSARELLQLKNSGGAGLITKGYPLLLATLFIALVFSSVLIVLPLLLFKRNSTSTAPEKSARASLLAYFLCLGLAFIMIEIAFIQKVLLFISHPLFSAALVISIFLLSAGLGSLYCGTVNSINIQKQLQRTLLLLIVVTLIVVSLLTPLHGLLAGQALAWRVLCVVLLLSPLGFLMGMPFPLGLSQLARHDPDWLPWAWGVNGCASVVGAVLATLLAIHWGFMVVILLALVFYGLAALIAPFPHSQPA